MKFFYLIALSFVVVNCSFAQSDPFLQDIAARWQNAKNYTIQVSELMPEEHYGFKPTPEEMSFSEQLVHLSDNMIWLSSSYLSDTKPTISKNEFAGKSKKEIIELCGQSFDYVTKTIQNFDASNLSEEIDFAGQKISRRRIILLINDHLTHHRAQMIVYLRLNGIKPPRYVGW